MEILIQFIQDNRLRLKDLFFQFDKDHSGDISKEEFKTGLKETGIEMSNVSGFMMDTFIAPTTLLTSSVFKVVDG